MECEQLVNLIILIELTDALVEDHDLLAARFFIEVNDRIVA
ncbi:hypothetical protein [Bacillus sp. AFS017336]|nr:hypothetical protein [Bacillus sp. AFS017336]